MNKFQDTHTGAFNLKTDYDPKAKPEGQSFSDILKKRRLKHADNYLGPKDQLNPRPREETEDEKLF